MKRTARARLLDEALVYNVKTRTIEINPIKRKNLLRLLRAHERELLRAAFGRFRMAAIWKGPFDTRNSSHCAIIQAAILRAKVRP